MMKAERWLCVLALSALAVSGAERTSLPPEAAPIPLNRLGTLDIFIVESSPVVFEGQPWLMEFLRFDSPTQRYRGNDTGSSCIRFLNMKDMKTVSPVFGKGAYLPSASVINGKIYVTSSAGWGKSSIWMTESSDMRQWSEPHTVLSGEGWQVYNTTLCQADGRYVMAFELGAPEDKVGRPFTMFFAESPDLKDWKCVEGASFGRDFYTGAPLLRYHAGWFYFFHLEADPERSQHYQTRVARSHDLIDWEISPRVVLNYDPQQDKRLHPQAVLTDTERAFVAAADDLNASDLDMCEYDGRLLCSYSWGNQQGREFLALGEIHATERAYCESFFPSASGVTDAERIASSGVRIFERGTMQGFDWTSFEFEGCEAWVVQPKRPTSGNPWVWCMEWPLAFQERMGVKALLEAGFRWVAFNPAYAHHVKVTEGNQNDEMIAKRHRYQRFLAKTLGLSERCGLIGMSWGGYYSIRYASVHPECVKAIYLDSPLLDFSTLSDFREKWKAYAPYWPTISADYRGADDPLQPVAAERVAKIAKAGIPVLCTYGGMDEIVPPESNCLRFAERFEKSGGHLRLWRDSQRGHHPHGIDPREQQVIVDFFAD